MPVGRLAAPFTELPFALLLLGLPVLAYGMFIPIDYLAAQAFQEARVSEEMAQYLVAIFNAARYVNIQSTYRVLPILQYADRS